MKKAIATAALITGMSTASFAGSLDTNTTVVEDDVFVATSSSSAAGLALPLAIGGGLVALGLIASDSSSGSSTTATTD